MHKRKFRDHDRVRHLTLGYYGKIRGETKLRPLFEGDTQVSFQYRIIPAVVTTDDRGKLCSASYPDESVFRCAAEHELEDAPDLRTVEIIEQRSKVWKRESELHKYGYAVRDEKGDPMSTAKRTEALSRFLKAEPETGLEQAIKTIIGNIDSRLKQKDAEKFAIAIHLWKEDLLWLAKKYPDRADDIQRRLRYVESGSHKSDPL